MQPVEYPGGIRRSAREPRRRRRDGEDDREAVGAVMAQQTGAEPDEDAPIEEDEFDEEDAAASLDASDDEDDVLPVPKQSKKAKKAAARAAVQQAGVRITVRFSLAKTAGGGGGGYVASKTNIKTFIVPADMIRWCPTTKMRYITVARVVELTKVQRCNLFGRIVDTRSSQVVETFNTALGDVEIAIDRSDKHLTLAAKEKTKPLEAVAPDDSSESETEAPVAVPVTTKSKALQRPEDNATLTQTYALADRLRIDSVEDDWFEKSGGLAPYHAHAAYALAKKFMEVMAHEYDGFDALLLRCPYEWTGGAWKLPPRPRWPDADAVAKVVEGVPAPPPRSIVRPPQTPVPASAESGTVIELLKQNGAMLGLLADAGRRADRMLGLFESGGSGRFGAPDVTPSPFARATTTHWRPRARRGRRSETRATLATAASLTTPCSGATRTCGARATTAAVISSPRRMRRPRGRARRRPLAAAAGTTVTRLSHRRPGAAGPIGTPSTMTSAARTRRRARRGGHRSAM